uniref:Uncharacterized protein n=1 Tax=Arundo donax TaxID=35708 RepID=A0A0A9BRM6_ARUDO
MTLNGLLPASLGNSLS